ncbi:MAG: hypothetical protein ACKO0Z_02900 [Betaproteobacteria bacterium]
MTKQPKKPAIKKSTSKKPTSKKVSIAEYTRRREVWLSALESGKFKQTTAQLHKIDEKGKHSFCCLGVACKVLGDEVGMESFKDSHGSSKEDKSATVGYRMKGDTCSDHIESADLPKAVADYLGMYYPENRGSSTSGQFKHGSKILDDDQIAMSLIDLNDHRGYSFQKIAEFIRKNPGSIWRNGTYKPLKKRAKKPKK